MTLNKKIICSILSLTLLNACGTAPAFLATSAGTYSEYKVVSLVKGGVDIGLSMADKPTTTDFALSTITGYDCRVGRALDDGIEYLCKKVEVHPPEIMADELDTKKEK